MNGGRAVVELSVPGVFHRQAQRGEHIQVLGGLQDGGQPLLRAPQQGILEEQVAAGVGRQAQFRKYHNIGLVFHSLLHSLINLLCIVRRVRHPDIRR